MDNRNQESRGFTLIELLVVIGIITILAGVLLPNIIGATQKAKEATTKAEIKQFHLALTAYWSDKKVYPEDDPEHNWSTRKFVEALKGEEDKIEYFSFKPQRIINGEYYSPLNYPYHYRENWSKHHKTPDMHNPHFVDIWTMDHKGREKGINNWE